MGVLGSILIGVAALAMLVFSIQILIMAFKTSVGWGLASLFIPFAVLVFVARHWEATRTPFLRSLACVPVYVIGIALAAYAASSAMVAMPTP